ncbi:hypothetical protein G6F65_020707 [Rhizopus arrhizus]|nr:hypothetical protein G6F65_020707 [Rhizopus arrhizus]
MGLRGDEHQAADHFLFPAEDRRANPHQAAVDLAMRDAHARGAPPFQVCAARIPVVPQPRFADFGRMPQHQVAQLVGRQIGQDGLGGGATEHRERTAARIAGFDRGVRPVAVHAQHLVAVVAAQHQVGVKLVAGGAHHVAGGAHQRIVRRRRLGPTGRG